MHALSQRYNAGHKTMLAQVEGVLCIFLGGVVNPDSLHSFEDEEAPMF